MTGTRLNDCTPTPEEQAKYTTISASREALIRRNHSLAEFKNGWGENKTGYKEGIAYDYWKEKDDLFHLLNEARAEIARLRAPPEADVMKLAWGLISGGTVVGQELANRIAHALTVYGEQRAHDARAAAWAEAILMVDDETHITHNFPAPPIITKMRERALTAYGDQRARDARQQILVDSTPLREAVAREARDAALEEAAQLCDDLWVGNQGKSVLAPKIRALKSLKVKSQKNNSGT
jgi:hypothetical protein